MNTMPTPASTTSSKKIADIKIGNRFRKDLGDIDSLAQSIQEIGLLHPVVINSNNELIAGQRRVEACKSLGWNDVPVTIINIKDVVKGEFHENSARKDFTTSEHVAILEEIEIQRSNLERDNQGKRSAEIAADYTGVSPAQLYKEKAIVQAVKQKPHLKYLVEKLDSGEMSVNEADRIIRHSEAESEKHGEWFRLKEEVMKEDSYKCRDCGDTLHLDVYTIDPYDDKHELENLETLCRDCHELKMKFVKVGLAGSFVWIFQELTGISGKRYFQYSIGSLDTDKKEDPSYFNNHLEQMKENPYSKLKEASHAERVFKTRKHREEVIESLPLGDYDVYFTEKVLNELLPILRDYQEMIDKEAAARRKKDKLSKP
jgi:ParB family chromosome partitioning protein